MRCKRRLRYRSTPWVPWKTYIGVWRAFLRSPTLTEPAKRPVRTTVLSQPLCGSPECCLYSRPTHCRSRVIVGSGVGLEGKNYDAATQRLPHRPQRAEPAYHQHYQPSFYLYYSLPVLWSASRHDATSGEKSQIRGWACVSGEVSERSLPDRPAGVVFAPEVELIRER